ncbi:MAG: SH3 domain-containing protein, partial [Chloroflexi bacterium]|nr:SH3 domain-containing protein [Chloroflexota bacterium]
YQRIDRLGVGSPFDIVQVQAGWANVVYHTPDTDYYGWVDAPYLARCTVTAGVAASSAHASGVRHTATRRVALVAASVLLVRQGPAAGQPVVGRLTHAQRVTILDQRGAWDYVRAGATVGWAFARWLRA